MADGASPPFQATTLQQQAAAGARGLSNAAPVLATPLTPAARGLSTAAPVPGVVAPTISASQIPTATATKASNGMNGDQLKALAAHEQFLNGSISPETTAYLANAGLDGYDPTADPNYAHLQTGNVGTPEQNIKNVSASVNGTDKNGDLLTTDANGKPISVADQLKNLPAARDAAIKAEQEKGFSGADAAAKFNALEGVLKGALAKQTADQAAKDKTAKQQQDSSNLGQTTDANGNTVDSNGNPIDANGNPITTPTNSTGSTSTTSPTAAGQNGSSASPSTTGGAGTTTPTNSMPKSTATFNAASQTINDAMNALNGMDPTTKAAYMPGLVAANNQMLDIAATIKGLVNKDYSKDPTVIAAQANADAVKTLQEAQKKDDEAAAQKAEEIQLQTLADSHEAALVDQQIIEQKQAEDEQAQMSTNMTNEATARRELIAAGVADDTNGLNHLATVIQTGVSKLASLRQADSLEILKAGIANGKQYNDTVSKAISDYEQARAKIDATANTAETTAQGIVTTKTGDAEAQGLKDIQTQLTEYNKLELGAATTIENAQKQMTSTQQKDASLAETKQSHADTLALRKEQIDNAAQAHIDALLQHGDAVAAQKAQQDLRESDSWYTKGRQAASKMTSDIKSNSPAISTFHDFSALYERWQAITNGGTLTSTNPETTTLLTDLFANANNPKLTARMPSATIEIYKSNLSPADNAKAFINKFIGNGSMDDRMLASIQKSMKDMNGVLFDDAQKEAAGYIVSAIHQNSLIPEQYRGNGIDVSDLTQSLPSDLISGAFKALGMQNQDLGDESSDGVPPPDDGGIMHGSSTSDSSTNGSFPPSAQMSSEQLTGNVDVSNTPLGNYTSQNGFRVTQGFNGGYDSSKGYTTGEHGAYDIAPPKPGETPAIPAYSAGKVIEIGTSGPYGNHFKVQDANGVTWLYGHLNSLNVKQGQQIAQGQNVGIMGETGQADGVHLHLEAYKDGKPYDFMSDPAYQNQSVASNQSNQS